MARGRSRIDETLARLRERISSNEDSTLTDPTVTELTAEIDRIEQEAAAADAGRPEAADESIEEGAANDAIIAAINAKVNEAFLGGGKAGGRQRTQELLKVRADQPGRAQTRNLLSTSRSRPSGNLLGS